MLQDVKLFLLDMDGTVYLGNTPIAGALEGVERLRASGKKICFVTNNSSRNKQEYIKKLANMGFQISEDEIFSSSDATIRYLKKHYPQRKTLLIGTKGLEAEFVEQGICLTDENCDVAVLGYDTTLTYEKLCKLTSALSCGVPFVATHPDVNCPAEGAYLPDVGSFLALLKASTGRSPDVICGKPFRPMADAIREKFCLQPQEIAMVGDRLSTDLLFGIENGFQSVLVLSGETDAAAYRAFGKRADAVFPSVKEMADSLV